LGCHRKERKGKVVFRYDFIPSKTEVFEKMRLRNEVRTLCGRKIWVGQKRIRDVMYAYEGKGNPILWFVKTLDDQDMIICGLPTKREALSEAERILKG
jgi:hypothetical protein